MGLEPAGCDAGVRIAADAGLLPHVRDVPAWFTSDTALIILGVLAALELIAERVPEAKGLLDAVHGYLKAGMAALTYLGVLDATDRATLAPLVQQAGLGDSFPALLVGAGALLASRVRGAVIAPLGAALLGTGADESVHSLIDLVYARTPYTEFQRRVRIHPNVSELLPFVLEDLKPLQAS